MITAPKLLLVFAIGYSLVASGHINSTLPGIHDETSSLIQKGETHGLWRETTASSDEPPSEIGFPDTNSTALMPRAHWDYMSADRRRRFHLADSTYFGVNYPLAIAGLVSSCRNFGNPLEGILCVYGAIALLWTSFLALDRVVVWTGSLIATIVEHALSKREDKIQGLLDDFSVALGAEVRHLGYWTDEDAPKIANLKRSLPEDGDNYQAVLGVNLKGYNFHFTHRGEIDGNALLRFGFGTDNIPNNKRHESPYFTGGGLDFLIQPVNPIEKGAWKDDDEHFDWMFEQIKCLLGEATLWDTKVENAPGVFFQMYDNMKSETVAAAAIAAFGEDGKSPIHEMVNLKSGIETSRVCMEYGKFDIWG